MLCTKGPAKLDGTEKRNRKKTALVKNGILGELTQALLETVREKGQEWAVIVHYKLQRNICITSTKIWAASSKVE